MTTDSTTRSPSFEPFQEELNRLVSVFEKGFKGFTAADYSEARLREDFLNPLFRALGWDLENKRGLVQSQREVEIESRTDVEGRAKRADYLFRVENRERFVCEAKKPREVLGDRYAFQAKRYAWNKGLPLAVLSDFEEIKIFIVGGKPHLDRADEGQWRSWNFRQYPVIAQELWDLLARERVAGGSIESLLESLPKAKPARGKARQQWLIRPERTKGLDQDFLEYLDEQRRALASDLLSNNPRADILSDGRLNEAAQRILDRLLFLRICEDRDIDTGIRLAKIVEDWRRAYGHEARVRLKQGKLWREDQAEHRFAAPRDSLWHAVAGHLCALDRRPPSNMPFFNGNLFKPHFCEELRVGDQWLCDFIEGLSADESPYLFNVIPVEILGSVYERFLGKVVRPHGRGVTIEEKPEVRKAGGVYYTPRYIVDYIVEQTVGRQLDAIAAEEKPWAAFDARTRALRILDPACGSGSFLIRAFERVGEHYQRRFTARPEDRKPERCWTDPDTGDVHLTVDLKRRILRDNIYGVDLDAQAVEVTQLSLYLKMLEGEDRTSIDRQRELFRGDIALLPPLENNIKHGNSLIASDFSLVPDDLLRVHAFDWDVQFRDIMKAGGFDAVIGNPPYIRIQTLQETDPQSASHLSTRYSVASKGNYDIYLVFVERVLSLLNERGHVGYILPHKFFNAHYGEALRQLISRGRHVTSIVHFGDQQVFEGATTYTCLLFLSKQANSEFLFSKVSDLSAWQSGTAPAQIVLPVHKLEMNEWTFSASPAAAVYERICRSFPSLSQVADRIFQGLVTGADGVFILENRANQKYFSEALGREVELETSLMHSLCKGSVNIRRYEIEGISKSILFPYLLEDGRAVLISKEVLSKKYPKCWEYLNENRKALESRERGKWHHDRWYAFGRSQNLAEMEQEKLLTPSLARYSSFVHDQDDFYYFVGSGGGGGGGYGITLKPETAQEYRYVLGLLNSRLLDAILKSISTPFANGYYAFNRQYIEQLPIRIVDNHVASDRARHDKLVELVDKMLALMPKLRAEASEAKRKILQNAVDATDRQIDGLVYELYGLTPEEIAIVEGAAP